jgi:hypothetical protein
LIASVDGSSVKYSVSFLIKFSFKKTRMFSKQESFVKTTYKFGIDSKPNWKFYLSKIKAIMK